MAERPAQAAGVLRLLSWNINRLDSAWQRLADDGALDVALLQEAAPPPAGLPFDVTPRRDATWRTAGWATRTARTAIAWRPDRVQLRPRRTSPVGEADVGDVPVSREGTLTVADLDLGDEVITVVSAYAFWESPSDGSRWIYADASAHRLVSDLSSLVSTERRHRVIVCGDFNLLHGYGEDGSPYWRGRYDTLFNRMAALGLPFVGPQAPNGRRAQPWPAELPRDSNNVPTFRSARQSVEGATRQLDFVFASKSLLPRLRVRALNEVDEWGPSDHCAVSIELDVAPPVASRDAASP